MPPVQLTKNWIAGGEVAVVVALPQQHRGVLEEPLRSRSPGLHLYCLAAGSQALGRDPGRGTGGTPDLVAVHAHRWIARTAARQRAQGEPQVERSLRDD